MKKRMLAMLTCALLLAALSPSLALAQDAPKYVFLFIGDGQSLAQITAARDYLGATENVERDSPAPGDLSFTSFPSVGLMTNHDATSFCPDSSSTASAMASGRKIPSGALNYLPDLTTPAKLITEYIKERADGRKVGVVTTVTLNHATPAAFYAKAVSRSDYYGIGLQGVGEGTVLDFLGGGRFAHETGKDGDRRSLLDIARENGFTVADTNESIRALNAESGRALATVSDQCRDGTLYYAIDAEARAAEGEDLLALSELVAAAIRVMDGEHGFFLMAEGGKIDWTQHANDAATGIRETINFSEAVQVALDFAYAHPEETLIVVTGDHETGGLSVGFAGTKCDTHLDYLARQVCSFEEFDRQVAYMRKKGESFSKALERVEKAFGLTKNEGSPLSLTKTDLNDLEYAYRLSMIPEADRELSAADRLLYYEAEPLTTVACRILDNRAGLSYSSFSHSGLPLPVYAFGARAERFSGSYDNTDLFFRLCEVMSLSPQ